MFDSKSDFALNKLDRDAIVCRSVTGIHIRLTREDFASEVEFLRWKVWAGGGPFHRGGHPGRAGRCRGQRGAGPQDRRPDRTAQKLPDWNAVPPSVDALRPKNECDRHSQGRGHLKSECIQVHQRRAEKYFCFFPGRGRK